MHATLNWHKALLKLLCQNRSFDKVQLWPWPLDPKMYRYLSVTILHLCMKSVRWYRIRTKMFPSCIYVWYMKAVSWENYSSYRVKTKVLTKFSCDLDLCTLKCIGVFLSPSSPIQSTSLEMSEVECMGLLTILHLYMKYESCTLKTTQVIVCQNQNVDIQTGGQTWFL